MKLQMQSGMGDLVFALPLIYDLAQREDVEIATNHEYVLDKAKSWGNITCSPVEFGPGGFPIIKDGFTHLRYDRYGAHYFDKYYIPYGKLPIYISISHVRETYKSGLSRYHGPDEYAVYAPPRAARRHINRVKSELFSCTPDPIYTKHVIDSYDIPMIIIGQEEVYAPIICMPKKFYDYRDKLNFIELCNIIANASLVISQVSAITALAGLYGIPTHFLKAASETEEQHEKHVNGVTWPGDEIIL
jgi:hypothetical protein